MVPEDVKRFTSIVIANGKLLFKQNCEKEETVQLTPNAEPKCGKCIQLPQREIESHQKSGPLNRQEEDESSPDLVRKSGTSVCAQVSSEFPVGQKGFGSHQHGAPWTPYQCVQVPGRH
jgi:hypothetical protein